MSIDPNRQLGGFVEGLVMGMIDQRRLPKLRGGWKVELDSAPDGTHAMYVVSPSGIRWRIRAVIEEQLPEEQL